MRRYNRSYRGHFSNDSTSESSHDDDERECLNRSGSQECSAVSAMSSENMEIITFHDHSFCNDHIDDDLDSEDSEIESELNIPLAPKMYIFMSHSWWNNELIVIASLLYACVMKSLSEDAFNCILSILTVNLGLTNIPHTLTSLKRCFKREVINYPQHTEIRSYCYNCRMVSLPAKGRSTPRCNNCREKLSLFANFDFFFQLRMILANHLECLRNYTEFLSISDMDNGDILYGSIKQADNPDVLNIHLLVSADGGNPYVTVPCSYWPIVAVILDLPPTLRYKSENMIFLSIWQGSKKPAWDVFLQMLLKSIPVNEMVEILIGDRILKCRISFQYGVFDLPAQASILNVKQFNGEFGCIFCTHPGISINRTWVYPFYTNTETISDEQYADYAHIADETGEVVYGIKGSSVLSKVLDIPSRITLDPLHLFFENITKMLLNYIKNPQNRHRPNYIGRRIKHVETAMLSLNTPYTIDNFRRFSETKFWTGRQFQNFLFYVFLPLIAFGFPYEYLQHLSTFVLGVRLSMSRDARQNSQNINKLFQFFVQHLEDLYTKDEMTINSHLLLHVGSRVRDVGSLFFSSMAPFEAQFKLMKRLAKGTKSHLSQVADKILLLKSSSAFLRANRDNDICNTMCSSLDISKFSRDTVEIIDANKLRIRDDIYCVYDFRKQDSYCKCKHFYGAITNVIDDSNGMNIIVRKFIRVSRDLYENSNIGHLLSETFSKFFSFAQLGEQSVTVPISDVICKCFLIEKVYVDNTCLSLLCDLPDVYTYT